MSLTTFLISKPSLKTNKLKVLEFRVYSLVFQADLWDPLTGQILFSLIQSYFAQILLSPGHSSRVVPPL